MKRSLPVWAALSLFAISSCAADPSSKRKAAGEPGEENVAAETTAAATPTISEEDARAKRPGMIIARVPVDKIGSEDFNNAEFVVVDQATETRFKDDLAKAYETASEKKPFSEEDQIALSFRQAVQTEEGLELCGGCGGGHRIGLFGFIGGVFHGVGRIVGGILHGAGAVVAGAVHGAATIAGGVVHGVGELLYNHKPIFQGWGWEYQYECGGYTDINDYRYYKYHPGQGKGTPSQIPSQHPVPPTQKPLPPIQKPVPPIGKGPIGKVPVDPTEPCPYGCPK